MSEDILDVETSLESNKRPVFLTVLCILTCVGSGLGLLGALVNIFTADMLAGQSAATFSQLNNTPFGGVDFEEMMKYSKYANIMNLIACLLCLAGAIIMFKLKRTGFYLYLIGAIVAIFASYISTLGFNSGFFASMGAVTMVMVVLFDGAFVVMYGLNLKHMK